MSDAERRVVIVDLAVNVDDRGELFEILRRDEPGFVEFGQLYFVRSREPKTIRAWHRHRVMWDHFCIVHGAAKFGFVDAEPGSPHGHSEAIAQQDAGPYFISASDRKPVRLDVPPGVWHGWVSLEPDTLLASIASEPYCGEGRRDPEPDEERLPAGSFGFIDVWEVEAK